MVSLLDGEIKQVDVEAECLVTEAVDHDPYRVLHYLHVCQVIIIGLWKLWNFDRIWHSG